MSIGICWCASVTRIQIWFCCVHVNQTHVFFAIQTLYPVQSWSTSRIHRGMCLPNKQNSICNPFSIFVFINMQNICRLLEHTKYWEECDTNVIINRLQSVSLFLYLAYLKGRCQLTVLRKMAVVIAARRHRCNDRQWPEREYWMPVSTYYMDCET